jgi:glycosyltransferase involved in cell wall biosynthesis
VIVCAGRFRHEKGHGLLVEALAELSGRRVPYHCVLAGEGPLRGEIEAQIHAQGLDDEVTLVGHLGHAELLDAIASAAVLAVPSTHEGMGLAAAEAVALGVPVVASRVGGLPEVVTDGQTGVLVESRRAEEFATALEGILNRPVGLLSRIRGDRSGVEHFNADTVAAAHECLFSAARAKRRRGAAE